MDFRALIRERKGAGTLEDILVEVFDSLVTSSKKGDVAAARLLLDKLTDDGDPSKAGILVRLTTGVPDDEGEA